MKYVMKTGVLFRGERLFARLRGALGTPEKRIYRGDGTLALRVGIRSPASPQEAADVRRKQYVIWDSGGAECAVASPGYAPGEAPEQAGWPVCRLPRVDHAQLTYRGGAYCLTMRSSQCYCLTGPSGQTVVEILHRGLAGGWDIEAEPDLPPELVCGIFVLCKYLEQENEFPVV